MLGWVSPVLLAVTLIAGCGFHLRGQADLSSELARTHIVGVSPYSEFAANLRQQLRANGVQVVEAEQSTSTLRITRNVSGKRVLSVDQNGKVLEFELYSEISFEVTGQDKTLLLKNQTISLSRAFLFDVNDVLGKAEEEALLREDLQEDVVRLIIYRLQTIGKS
jgi:LPS-assembly lipoprotein